MGFDCQDVVSERSLDISSSDEDTALVRAGGFEGLSSSSSSFDLVELDFVAEGGTAFRVFRAMLRFSTSKQTVSAVTTKAPHTTTRTDAKRQ